MPNKIITFHGGLVTSRDPATLRDGELTQAVGCEYREGSPHIYKQPGRKSSITYGSLTSLGNAVQAIHRLEYQIGTDKLVYYTAAGSVFETNVYTAAASSAALDNSGVAYLTGLTGGNIPFFATLRDRWIMLNGTDSNYIREPEAVPGGSTGNWRTLGMQPPPQALTLGTGPVVAGQLLNGTDSGATNTDYNDNANVADVDSSTFAYGKQAGVGSQAQDYTFSANFSPTVSNGKIRIVHSGGTAATSTLPPYVPIPPGYLDSWASSIDATHKITVTGGAINYSEEVALPYALKESYVDIGSVDPSTLTITCTVENFTPNWPGADSWAIGRVHLVQAHNEAATEVFTANDVTYGYTERYIDSQGVRVESNMSPLLQVTAQEGVYGIKLEGFPASAENSFTTEYVIYRSLDEDGGGFPFMYEIASIEVGVTTYTDLGDISLTDVTAQQALYETVNVLYPDGSTFAMEVHGPPPIAQKAVPFQGSMVYVPANSNRLYYSRPASISAVALEQVPPLYYLEFATPHNDVVNSIEPGNSGRSLIVYFSRYSMMVNFLPQATDPGVFDQRIHEYVSNTRGAFGPHATTEVTLGNGRTFAVAADALGLWATDGVSMIEEWSVDIKWEELLEDATVGDIRLVNNPLMDRLEMLYDSNGSSVMKELHFYYGRMKEDGEGGQAPVISGPHPASTGSTDGWRCKHYANISNVWAGWSGDNSTTGDVFIEREHAPDDSLAYDGASPYVPFQVKTGDDYVNDLSGAHIVTFSYPKFGASGDFGNVTTKTLDPTASNSRQGLFGSFRRDGNSATATKNKPYLVNTQKKVYWQMYADRHTIQIKDISETSLPELVAYEVETRETGQGVDA